METYEIYSGGEFTSTNKVIDVINPYNGQVIARTYLAGKVDLEAAITAAERVVPDLGKMSSHMRFEILLYISEQIKKERQHLADVLTMESGKPMRYALGEIERAAQTFLVAAEESKRLPKEYISLDWTPPGKGMEGLVKYFPLGLIAGISPFNFPLNLAVHKIAPAIASGNAILLKPARSTPLSLLELAKILHRSDLPRGAVSILPMDRESGNQLVTDERIKMLSFTGSPEVGWTMKRDAGKKKVLLELGGNAGVIISAGADIDHAVRRCLVGGFAYSGQVCIHVQRIFVHKEVFDDFIKSFCHGVERLVYGDPMDPNTEISSMIDEENAIRVESWVSEAVRDGSKVLAGGKRKGNYYEPTVITNTNAEMKVCSREIFGPVVTVEKFGAFNEAIKMVNGSRYGLQAGVFTNDSGEERAAFQSLEVGGVIINDVPTFRVDHMPYGGIKDSGLGREGVKYSIIEMMEPKLLARKFL